MFKRYFTFEKVMSALFLTFSVLSVPFFIMNFKVGIICFLDAILFLFWIVWYEVRNLKDWGRQNVEQLVQSAEATARAAYKLKNTQAENYLLMVKR
ncbi:hypothetical protein [Gallibacterium genomosp. 1]|uniref:Uncharacterized protein n=1 Tax=Gallibacterium genomosp. 1 TaxID=155515 RepID=A0A0A2XVM6_9PAST|nr:hypothetical protein [Gallibacterium genomosp. 1]KGQ36471.1 hypothetical protein JP36_10075 [Gallibacterium genomosp. 1]